MQFHGGSRTATTVTTVNNNLILDYVCGIAGQSVSMQRAILKLKTQLKKVRSPLDPQHIGYLVGVGSFFEGRIAGHFRGSQPDVQHEAGECFKERVGAELSKIAGGSEYSKKEKKAAQEAAASLQIFKSLRKDLFQKQQKFNA